MAALGDGTPANAPEPLDGPPELSRSDRLLVHVLAEDGRCTYDELARVSGVSEATARRRLGALRREGRVRIRAVIEPVLWVRAAPAAVAAVTAGLVESNPRPVRQLRHRRTAVARPHRLPGRGGTPRLRDPLALVGRNGVGGCVVGPRHTEAGRHAGAPATRLTPPNSPTWRPACPRPPGCTSCRRAPCWRRGTCRSRRCGRYR
ncbi:AsnC family protein [Streptomyces sp. NPDC001617]